MRRSVVLAARMLQHAGAAHQAGSLAMGQQALAATSAAGLLPAAARCFADHAKPEVVANPLQQIVPPIIQGTGAAIAAATSATSSLLEAAASSGATKAAIAYFADKVLLSGTFVDVKDIDVPKWASWLASNGYSSSTGWAAITAAVKEGLAAGTLSAADVEVLVPALDAVGLWERNLSDAFAAVIKAKFTEFTTPGLADIITVYAAHDSFDVDLYDDVADSITYCNHYFAPTTVSLPKLAAVFAAYAKYGHDRADLFIALARTIHEDRLKALPAAELRTTVVSLLSSFNKLGFWPDVTEALLVVATKTHPVLFAGDAALLAEVTSKLRDYSGGSLDWLDGGYTDWEHFHGKPFGEYNLWVTRDDLFPQYYRPSDVRVLKST